MAAVDTIFDSLGKMTVLELVELKNKIEEEWGITAAAPVAVAAAPGAATATGAAAVMPHSSSILFFSSTSSSTDIFPSSSKSLSTAI